jgi:hypothetical protein
MDNGKLIDPSSNVYFAAADPNECASTLMKRAHSFYDVLRANSYLDKITRMWEFYHGQYYDSVAAGHRISFGGEQGELSQIPVNHFRNLAQHIYVMVTSQRPVMEARALNTDYKSLSQTYIANGILDYYMRERKLESCLKKAVEMSIVLGAGYIKLEWNATEGEIYDTDEETGSFNYEGDLVFTNLSPYDVVIDGTRESWNNEWVMCRSFQNRYNLMAKYPELAAQIQGIPSKTDISRYRIALWSNDETDDIPVYEFFHKRTEAVPDGRYMLFLDSATILLDTKMPYRQIPVFRIVPSEIMGTPYGYTPMFDIYPIQEAINALYGTIMSNQNAFGVQSLFVPRGSDLNFASLQGGMNIIEADQPPQAINLTQTPAEVFKFLEMMISSAETISGVNSVARGNPEANLKSGNALALVQSMALQFISGLQQSYVQLVEDVGTSLIDILKDFAAAPRVIQIVGKNNRPYLKEFNGEDLNSISRVIVDLGNALSRTTAGRVQMAEQLLQMKLLKNPEQYFQVINTGRLDPTFQGEEAELLLIQRENERLLSGQPTVATAMDSHQMHIQEHRNVINDPDLRMDPNLLKNVQDHVQEHMNFLTTTDPRLLQLLGQQPLPPLQPPAPPQGAPGPGGPIPAMPPGAPPPQMAPMMAPQQGPMSPGQPIQGNATGPNINIPKPAMVPAQLLPNPALQEQSLGNVKTLKPR